MRDLRKVIAAAPIAIVVADARGQISLVNQQAERLFGYDAAELMGRSVDLLVPERFRAAHPALRAGYAEEPTTRSMGAGRDLYGLRKDGTEVPIEIGLNPVETDEGRCTLAAILDITERKRSEEHLRLVVDAAPQAMLVVDTAGVITLANAQASELFAYTREELLGTVVEALIPLQFRHGHAALRTDYAELPTTRRMGAGRELFALRKDGVQIPVEIGLSPLSTPKGNFVLASIADITERKNAEEMRLQRDRAIDASQLKSQFVATMSHELRTPLNAIIGMAELLGTTRLDDRQRTFVEGIDDSAEALLAIISSILDLSKIEAGKLELGADDFDLETLVEASAGVLAQHMRDKGLKLYVDVDPSIPPLVRGDADRLRQILLNLLANALKFTDQGHVVLRARPVETSRRHAIVRFEIEDTGIGIAPDVVPKLFEPFVQADSSSSRRYGGTGLGLSISKRLVELMQGEIGVDSVLHQGSTFWFSARFARGSAAVPARRVFGVRALIVSPDALLADIFDRWLSAWGIPSARAAQTTAVAGAARSRQGLREDWVVLADAESIDRDALLAALREAEISDESIISIGNDEGVTKPVRQSTLFERIIHTLGQSDAEIASPAPSSAADAAAAGTVLIAEDNDGLRDILEAQFARIGRPVTIVNDGAQAIDAVSHDHYALVLMDVQMPNVDGFAATRAIRAREQVTGNHIPIIAMTANAFKEDRDACLAAGMDDYLSKPLRINDLRAMIDRWSGAEAVTTPTPSPS